MSVLVLTSWKHIDFFFSLVANMRRSLSGLDGYKCSFLFFMQILVGVINMWRTDVRNLLEFSVSGRTLGEVVCYNLNGGLQIPPSRAARHQIL